MLKRPGVLIITGLFQLISLFVSGQQTGKWENKNRGTYIITFNHKSFISDTLTTYAGIKFYELAEGGLKKLTGNVTVNGIEHIVYDSSEFSDAEGFKDISNYTHIKMRKGDYTFSASAGNDYYPVTTGTYFFDPLTTYSINFYFIRKKIN